MRILIVEPEKAPKTTEISGNLTEMQRIVSGTIQAIYPFPEGAALICNDEGKMLGLPLNRALRDENGKPYDIVCGTFFLCGAPSGSDCFVSLTFEQLERFQTLYRTPEMFLNMGGQIVCLPLGSV